MMQFILNGRKCFGNAMNVILEIMEDNGIELDVYDLYLLVDMVLSDELPQRFYKDGLLNVDMIKKDPGCLENIVLDSWI